MNSIYPLYKNEQYIKCYNDTYIKSCKISKEHDDSGTGLNTCDNVDWDAQTRVNVGLYCRVKLNHVNPTSN